MTTAAEEGQQRMSVSSDEIKMENVEEDEEEDAIVERGLRRRQSSVLFPPERLDSSIQELAFLDLKYEVETMRPGKEAETLTVLDGVSGQANSGEMLALMGPSGSGKTSVLNVLAQRVPRKSVTGSVFVDGSPLSRSFKRRMGFVFQDDVCLWNLTVRETVMFAAKLRLPQETSDKEKDDRVVELLELLGLSHVADALVGKEGKRGISGGERKRVSIGVELITSPDVIFLDEPTSGLDSSTALTVINILRKLTKEVKMIVMCSIHQPRSNIFSVFDKVLLLRKGRMVFYGPRRSIIKYFERLGLTLPPETNPADWILDLTTSPQILADGKSLEELFLQFMAEPARKELAMGLPTESTISKTRDRLKGSGSDKSVWVTSFWYQLRVLLQRQSKQSRGEVFNSVNLGLIFAVAVLASAIWWQSRNIADIAGAMFFTSIQQAFNGLNTSIRVFPPERSLMIRERSTGSYRVGPYFLAKSTSDMGIYTAAPILFATIVYWSVGLRPDAGAFFIFLLLFTCQVIVGQSMGLFVSAAITDIFAAQSFAFVLILCLMLFGGFYVNSDNIPEGIWWIRYLSFLYYGFGALLYNEYDLLSIERKKELVDMFRTQELPVTAVHNLTHIPNRAFECAKLHGRQFQCEFVIGKGLSGLKACANGGTRIITGEDILDEYGFPDVNVWENIAVLAGMIVGFRLLTYIIMRHSTKLRT